MPTIETIILRRSYPVPVTHTDRKRAYAIASAWVVGITTAIPHLWNAALKQATGATDDIYALIDGHEVRVATVTGSGESATANLFGCISAGQAASILIAADEAGYWERPHEVRVVLQERPVSVAAVERAVNVGWTVKGGAA